MRPSAAFNSPPRLWWTAWGALQGPSTASMCQPPQPHQGHMLIQLALPCSGLEAPASHLQRQQCSLGTTSPLSVAWGVSTDARGDLAFCYSPAPGKTGSRKDAHPWQQLLPQVLWTILQVHQQPVFGVGIAANIATGFCCFQAALSAAVPSASMADRMVNEALKAFQLRLNFSALQFKTKLSRSVSDNLVWFLRR